nr:hypothetical protein [Halobacillus andaensis]
MLTIAAGLQPLSYGRVLFEDQKLAKLSSDQLRKIRARHFRYTSSHLNFTAKVNLSQKLDYWTRFLLEV